MKHSRIAGAASRLYRAVALLVVLSLASAGGALAQSSESDQVQQIIDDVVELRGLDLETPINVTYMTRSDFQASLSTDFFEGYTEADQQRDTRTLVAFGVLEPGQDLLEIYKQLYGGQVYGYYDPRTAELVVITDDDRGGDGELTAMEEWSLAHEINHALQDQHFDIDGGPLDTSDADTDVSLAADGLVEGDATLIQLLYVQEKPSFARKLRRELSSMPDDNLKGVPSVLVDITAFPYDQGFEFALDLYDNGGWDEVNAAFAKPPTTSEQVLHPDKYRDGEVGREVPVIAIPEVLGRDWTVTDDDSFGEFVIRSLLSSQDKTKDDAGDAAAGWDGDAYAVAGNGDQTVVVWQTAWDSEDDAAEFARAFAEYDDTRLDANTENDGDLYTVEGDGVIVLVQIDGDEVTYVQAPDLDTAQTLLDAQLAG